MNLYTVGDRIKYKRLQNGVSWQDLAKYIGVGYSSIAAIEDGQNKTSFFWRRWAIRFKFTTSM